MSIVVRIPISSEPEFYTESLYPGVYEHLLYGELEFTETFLRHVKQLLHIRYAAVMRAENVRYILLELSAAVSTRKINICFPLFSREQPYMTDDGNFTFPLYFLYASGGQRVMKIVLHEAAHWWLACQAEYDALLKEDHLYWKNNRGTEEQRCLSPVEYCATILSCELMESISKYCDADSKRILTVMTAAERKGMDNAISEMIFCQNKSEGG